MDYFEFFLFAEEHVGSLIFFSIALVICYFALYKKHIQSIFDPFFLTILISGLSASTVFFLYYNNGIREEYFYQFIATEIAFMIGFFLLKPIKFNDYLKKTTIVISYKFNENFSNILFYLSSILHVFFQLLTYLVVGIPLFLDSRMSTFAGGSGFGFVGRILEVVSVVGIFLLFYRIFYCKNRRLERLYNYFYLVLIVLFLLLSGSKTNLIFLVYYLFFVNLFMMKIKGYKIQNIILKTAKYQKILLYSSIPLIFLVMYIQLVNSGAETAENSPFLALGQRIISFGDIYYMTLPNDVIKIMNNNSGFLQLFKDPLGMLRFVSWEKLPLDCGIEIYQYHYPNGTLSGPNARYNYFSMLYFGPIGQVIYCFLFGVLTSFLRNTLFKILPNNIVYGVIYTLFSINLVYIFQDQAFAIARFFNIIILVPILLLVSLLIQFLLKFNPLKKEE